MKSVAADASPPLEPSDIVTAMARDALSPTSAEPMSTVTVALATLFVALRTRGRTATEGSAVSAIWTVIEGMSRAAKSTAVALTVSWFSICSTDSAGHGDVVLQGTSGEGRGDREGGRHDRRGRRRLGGGDGRGLTGGQHLLAEALVVLPGCRGESEVWLMLNLGCAAAARPTGGATVSSLVPLGAAGIVASVVPVDDVAAVPIMLALHDALRSGATLPEALQAARTATRDDPMAQATAQSFISLGA
jgi:CHAT domain